MDYQTATTPKAPVEFKMDPSQIINESVTRAMAKYNHLTQDVWAKVEVWSRDQCVAKALLHHHDVTINATSKAPFDGHTLGLKRLLKRDLSTETKDVLKELGKGLLLSTDGKGNVLAALLPSSTCQPTVLGTETPQRHCVPAELIEAGGRIGTNTTRVFDVTEFKSHVLFDLLRENLDKRRWEKLTVTCISLNPQPIRDQCPPCWIIIINFAALDLLNNKKAIDDVKTLDFLNLSDPEYDVLIRRNWALHEPKRRETRVFSDDPMTSPGDKKDARKGRRDLLANDKISVADGQTYSWTIVQKNTSVTRGRTTWAKTKSPLSGNS